MSEVRFAVVQTIEGGQAKLSTLPEHWTKKDGYNAGIPDKHSDIRGRDLMFWPTNAAARDLEQFAETDLSIQPDGNCRSFRCIIKRTNCKDKAEVRFLIRFLSQCLYCR